jgi:tryptophanyl-tRNA synthetase
MATTGSEAVLPIREGEKKPSSEQQIDPWDVQAGHDENGNALAFDYVAISQCDPKPSASLFAQKHD